MMQKQRQHDDISTKKRKDVRAYLGWFLTRPVHEQFFLASVLPPYEVIHEDGNNNQTRSQGAGISPAHNAPANAEEFDKPAGQE